MIAKKSRSRYVVVVALLAYLFVAVASLILIHIRIPKDLNLFPLLRDYLICGGFGVIGSAVASLRKCYQAMITEDTIDNNSSPPGVKISWDGGWMVYYLTRPIIGGVLGAVVYLLSVIGIQIMVRAKDFEVAPEGRTLLFAIAFCAGYAASAVLTRVDLLSQQIFKPRLASEEK